MTASQLASSSRGRKKVDQLLFKDITVRASWVFRCAILYIGYNWCVMDDMVLLNLIDQVCSASRQAKWARRLPIKNIKKHIFFNKITHKHNISFRWVQLQMWRWIYKVVRWVKCVFAGFFRCGDNVNLTLRDVTLCII